MMHTCLIPTSDEDDLANAMATQLRAGGVDLCGSIDDVESRAIIFLMTGRRGTTTAGYRWADIKPRLTTVIAEAKRLGPINLQFESTSA